MSVVSFSCFSFGDRGDAVDREALEGKHGDRVHRCDHVLHQHVDALVSLRQRNVSVKKLEIYFGLNTTSVVATATVVPLPLFRHLDLSEMYRILYLGVFRARWDRLHSAHCVFTRFAR